MNQHQHFLQTLPQWEKLPADFFSDTFGKFPIAETHPIYKLIKVRSSLKEFCRSQRIRTPEFFSSDRFEKISAWAVSRNKFPMVLKTVQNLHDGELTFLLKAFRELPEFHELISQSGISELLIEDFAVAKAYIEATTVAGKIKMTSQFSLERNMRMRHSWRAFPINLPQNLNRRVQEIISRFPGLEDLHKIPIRFSFALTAPEITLLTVNAGLNRPEYNPLWCQKADLPTLFDDNRQNKTARLHKILCFYNEPPVENFEQELSRHCGKTILNYFSDKGKTILMLGHESPDRLQEFSRWISACFLQTADQPLPQPNEDK